MVWQVMWTSQLLVSADGLGCVLDDFLLQAEDALTVLKDVCIGEDAS